MGESLQGVNDTGNVTKNCQQDVDQQVSPASALEEDTKRWEEDSKNDLADIAMERISRLCTIGNLD